VTTDTSVYAASTRAATVDITGTLMEILGPRLTGHLAGVSAKTVGRYANGTTAPGAAVEARLRAAFQAAQVILGGGDSEHTVRAWFIGLNPQLDDRSAARLVREGELDEVGPQILSAARVFVGAG